MMTEKEFLEEVLGFSKPWYISEVVKSKTEITIKLDFPKGTLFVCPYCGNQITAYDTKWKEYRHLDWWQYKTFIKVKVPRIKCCKKAETVDVEWLRKGSTFTQMMEAHILELCKMSPVSRVAKLLGVTDTRIWRLLHFWVDKCRAKADFAAVCNIGIDETSKKGHAYITNFVDLEKRKVMYVSGGKDSGTIAEFKRDFKAHGGVPLNIENVTCDMSLAFESGVKKTLATRSLSLINSMLSSILTMLSTRRSAMI